MRSLREKDRQHDISITLFVIKLHTSSRQLFTLVDDGACFVFLLLFALYSSDSSSTVSLRVAHISESNAFELFLLLLPVVMFQGMHVFVYVYL